MSHIVLVSLDDEYCHGLRLLVAGLKAAGHRADLICFKQYTQVPIEEAHEVWDECHIQVLPCGDFVNSYSYPTTDKERCGKPLIFGGPHPTTSPEWSLRHADFVCRGEADEAILDIAGALDSGGDLREIAHLCYLDGAGSSRFRQVKTGFPGRETTGPLEKSF